jgi:hypothetical protein
MRRIAILLLAVTVVVGITTQMVARAWAIDSCPMPTASTAHMPTSAPSSDTPCKGQTPGCVDMTACITTVAVLAAPVSAPIAISWAPVTYSFSTHRLDGRSVEPELSPPILTV